MYTDIYLNHGSQQSVHCSKRTELLTATDAPPSPSIWDRLLYVGSPGVDPSGSGCYQPLPTYTKLWTQLYKTKDEGLGGE